MSQVDDFTIPTSPLQMASLATVLEAAFAALGSMNRGAPAPPAPYEGMLWWDNSANPEILKRYTVTAGWVSILSVNITTGALDVIGYVTKALFDANTILAAMSDNTPAAVAVAEQRILGRKTGGNIAALTAAEVNAILGGAVLPWALISDVKATTVHGGTTTGGTYHNRTLNTLTGISGYGDWCSLASSMFSLAVGTYYIEASAPAHQAGEHQACLYNVDTSTYELIGTSEYAHGTYGACRSVLQGLLTVSNAAHRYRIVHYCATGQPDNGLGRASGSGRNEVYTVVKITKHS
jgi:hypothetical protein